MPKRSAMAPAIGWPRPHNRFCSASARPKTSRPQANSRLIGWMKKPRLERGPKLNSAIRHPQMMMTSGVRQVPRPEDGRRSPVVTAMCFPCHGARNRQTKCYGELMHLHENPKRAREKNFPLQGSPAKLARAMRAIPATSNVGAKRESGSGRATADESRNLGFRLRSIAWLSGMTATTELPFHARLLGRALCGFGELGGDRRGLGGRTPARRVAAVAPGARPVEGVHAGLVHLLHFIDPGRPHPIGVVVRRLVDFRQPELAVEHRFRDLLARAPTCRVRE